MSLRKKIILIMLPIMLFSIIIVNAIFTLFFIGYVKEHETAKIDADCNSLYAYLNVTADEYLGTVNDWSHWDDTYEFINGLNPQYAEINLNEEDFINLNMSFFIFYKDASVFYKKLYDFDSNQFIEFDNSLMDDFNKNISYMLADSDTTGIYLLGGDFFFIVASDITDSLEQAGPSGKLLLGRKIDDALLKSLESLLTIDIVSISTQGGGLMPGAQGAPQSAVLEKSSDKIVYECYIHSSPMTLVFTLQEPRDIFAVGVSKLSAFLLTNVLAMLIFIFSGIIILNKYISKPFQNLINEVSSIDIVNIQSIKEQGRYEFAFLEKSINRLLENIEQKQSMLKESEQKLSATLLSVGDGVIVVNRSYIIEFINPVAEELTGWSDGSALEQPFNEVFNIINEYTRQRIESPVAKVFEINKILALENHTLLISKNNREVAIEDTAAPIRDRHGKTIGCVLVFRDFSDRRERQREIEYLSYHDQLTGLYNRRYFEDTLGRLDTEENLPITIVYADLNGLKTLNDAFGHQCGDEIVIRVGDVLTAGFRKTDVIARMGGDEFIIFMPCTPAAKARDLSVKIKERLEKEKINSINISISFGGSTKISMEQPIWEVLKAAEDDMYRWKMYSSASQRSSIVKSILNTLMLKNPREDAHSKRVSALCEAIANAYNLDDFARIELKTAGELHDIGKIAIDDTLLNKSGQLTDEEWEQIKKHPETGYRLLSTSNEFYRLAGYVLAHHERWDGKGYPKGIKGKNIDWSARVICIADSYDAMTCERPYRPALSKDMAIAEIKRNAGTQFDPDIARTFVEKVLGVKWNSIQ